MNARQIQAHIIGERFRVGTTVPNYTPEKWFECDVFEVTKNGYFREYEVKVTRPDFRADAEKRRDEWRLELQESTGRTAHVRRPGESKHSRLERGDPKGPRQFWFVVPQHLVRPEECPPWAGLIWCWVPDGCRSLRSREVVPAPQLHREKLAQAVHDHARGVCYWRFLRLFLKHGRKS